MVFFQRAEGETAEALPDQRRWRWEHDRFLDRLGRGPCGAGPAGPRRHGRRRRAGSSRRDRAAGRPRPARPARACGGESRGCAVTRRRLRVGPPCVRPFLRGHGPVVARLASRPGAARHDSRGMRPCRATVRPASSPRSSRTASIRRPPHCCAPPTGPAPLRSASRTAPSATEPTVARATSRWCSASPSPGRRAPLRPSGGARAGSRVTSPRGGGPPRRRDIGRG